MASLGIGVPELFILGLVVPIPVAIVVFAAQRQAFAPRLALDLPRVRCR